MLKSLSLYNKVLSLSLPVPSCLPFLFLPLPPPPPSIFCNCFQWWNRSSAFLIKSFIEIWSCFVIYSDVHKFISPVLQLFQFAAFCNFALFECDFVVWVMVIRWPSSVILLLLVLPGGMLSVRKPVVMSSVYTLMLFDWRSCWIWSIKFDTTIYKDKNVMGVTLMQIWSTPCSL